ncbi:MAG: tRNA (adenosine(37)-N6)-threonylcarbamoyltransferase complex transferase subunit TsaD [Candidatus Pacebacteria bacterium]|nr:tRNA (adenosine(37)-N6)-threonylcarbamoyltransferase complex transferase subunit TsaD [Candidatus Paceibacterota bacterium]
MIILGIETSCDETSIGILEAKKTKAGFFIKPLNNTISSQIKIHQKYGGVVPMLANREHTKNIPIVFRKALRKTFGSEENAVSKIDLITVTKGPGLILSLLIGVNFAKTLAWFWEKPIIGINHLEGHLFSFLLPEIKYPKPKTLSMQNAKIIFPAVCLLISGGHTQLIYIKKFGDYKIIGETRDDAAGECFDKGARILGLDYPGGPAIAKEASKYKKQGSKYKMLDTEYKLRLPRPMINSQDYDFSFSGLKTALLYLTQEINFSSQKKKLTPILAYELEEAITDVLIIKTIKAAKNLKAKSIILAGGVSANQRLREKFQEKLRSKDLHNINFYAPLLEYTTDNAIMIALIGFFHYLNYPHKKFWTWEKIQAEANLRL